MVLIFQAAIQFPVTNDNSFVDNYKFNRWFLIQIICTHLYGFKYPYLKVRIFKRIYLTQRRNPDRYYHFKSSLTGALQLDVA